MDFLNGYETNYLCLYLSLEKVKLYGFSLTNKQLKHL